MEVVAADVAELQQQALAARAGHGLHEQIHVGRDQQAVGVDEGAALGLRGTCALGRSHAVFTGECFGSGAIIGIAEAIFVFNSFDDPGRYDAALFVLVLVAVLALARRQTGDAGKQSMSFAARTRAIPPQLERVWWVRRLPLILTSLAIAIAAVLPFVITQPSRHFLYAEILLFAIIAMSLTLLTGWAGQLSLGQVAFVGLGAMLTTAFANLATLVPSGPGFVGTFEAGVLLAVNGALGVGRGLALSYAVLLHVLLWAPVTLWGAILWWRIGLAGTRHVRLTEAVEDEMAPPRAGSAARSGAGGVGGGA